MAGWLVSLCAGCALVFKARFELSPGAMFLPIFALFFPFLGLLALAVMAKKINRCARAASALKTEAEAGRRAEREKDEALAQRIDYWLDHPNERKYIGELYYQSAKRYTLENSVTQFEEMLQEEIADCAKAQEKRNEE